MITLALNSFSRSSMRSPPLSAITKSSQAGPHFRRRWLHQTRPRNAILMPAMSPFMTSGTITQWKKKEGEAFAAGDVLLQIESDIAIIDVEAVSAGILGKILMPDGSQNVPVEQVIALVVGNERDIMNTPYNPIPLPPGPSPVRTQIFVQPSMSPMYQSPTAVEIHDDHNHNRGMATHQTRGQKLTIVPSSPRLSVSIPTIDRSTSSAKPHFTTSTTAQKQTILDSPLDGAAIRRLFRLNLSRAPLSGYNSPLTGNSCDIKDYFDDIL